MRTDCCPLEAVESVRTNGSSLNRQGERHGEDSVQQILDSQAEDRFEEVPHRQTEILISNTCQPVCQNPFEEIRQGKEGHKKVANEPAPLGHPTDVQARQEAVKELRSRMDALKVASKRTTRGMRFGVCLELPHEMTVQAK